MIAGTGTYFLKVFCISSEFRPAELARDVLNQLRADVDGDIVFVCSDGMVPAYQVQ